MRFVNLGGITLHYALEGQTGQREGIPLVFIHSLGTDLRLWEDVLPPFTTDHLIVRYDLRGHGLSDSPPGPYTIQNHVDDLAALLNALEIDQAILIGISVGGQIAMGYAAVYPERIKALILADTGTTIGTAQSWNQRISDLRTKGMDQLVDVLVARWFTPTFARQQPALYHGFGNLLKRTPLNGYIATCEALRDADLSVAAHAIQAKTLILCGSEDVSTPPASGRVLSERIPKAQFRLIEGAAHLPCVEKSDQFTNLMKVFLQEMGYGG